MDIYWEEFDVDEEERSRGISEGEGEENDKKRNQKVRTSIGKSSIWMRKKGVGG